MAQLKEYMAAIHTDEKGIETAICCHVNDFDDDGYHKKHHGEFGWRFDELTGAVYFKHYYEAYNACWEANDPEGYWNEMKIHGL